MPSKSASFSLQSIGSGPDLICIHGWGLHAGVWGALVALLQERFRFHLIDLPGYGQALGDADWPALDDLAAALLDRLPTGIWLGWSLGGLIAARAAILGAERVRGLALLCATPCFVAKKDWPHGMAPATFNGFVQDLERDCAHTLRRFIALQVVGTTTQRQDLSALRALLDGYPTPHLANLRAGLHTLAETDLRHCLGAVRCPSLLLGGGKDALVSAAAVRHYAQLLPRAVHRIEPQWGHAPLIGHTQQLATHLTNFAIPAMEPEYVTTA